jgi:elongation factor G
MHANKRDASTAGAGTSSPSRAQDSTTGDTLCQESKPIILESIEFYNPVIGQAIEAKTPADQEKLPEVLAKISEEDPTLKVKYDEETAQTIISGMGELHLEIVVDRLLREYNIHVNVGKPRVVYRETIQKSVEIDGRFERELGEKKHFGHVKLVLEPLPRGAGIEIKNELPPETIPAEFHPVIEESLGEAVFSGVLAGYPVLDVRIRITGGSFKEGDASSVGYKIAAATAFKDGCAKADPVLLEPIMVDIFPRDFMGEVIGDINARKEKGSVTPKGPSPKSAHVPLRSLFGYSTDCAPPPRQGDIHHAVPRYDTA